MNSQRKHMNFSKKYTSMAKQVDAVDLKSAVPNGTWGFDSPSGYMGSYADAYAITT